MDQDDPLRIPPKTRRNVQPRRSANSPKKPPKLPERPVYLDEPVIPQPTAEIKESIEGQISNYQREQLAAILGEQLGRMAESLRLYEPLAVQNRFHASRKPERVLRGSNRGGKTLPAAVEIARAVTGQDPFNKYPLTDGRVVAVGKDGKHIAETMYYKLSRARAFKIIRDKETKLWRSFRPWDQEDADRAHEAKPSPPLIPQRFIKAITWEDKKGNQPKKIIFTNGWEMSFYSSLGKPPQGLDTDIVWFDEEIVDPEWYSEMAARTLDRQGCFIWSATPQAATQELFELHCRFVDGDEFVEEFHIKLADNPHISEAAKEGLKRKLSPEEQRVRIEGEYAITSFRVYPEFNKGTHLTPWFDIPADWMRIAAIDPGRQVLAVLFFAIPPPGCPNHIYLYKEVYIQNADKRKFGEAMQAAVAHDTIHEFIIDSKAARQTEIGSGKTVEEQYKQALKKYGIKSETRGFNFVWGSTDIKARELALRDWLIVRPTDGRPRLLVLEGVAPNFCREMERYHYKRIKGLVTDEPEQRNNHTIDCAQYSAARDPRYRKPSRPSRSKGYTSKMLKAKAERRHARGERDRRGHISLGPGGGEYGTRR